MDRNEGAGQENRKRIFHDLVDLLHVTERLNNSDETLHCLVPSSASSMLLGSGVEWGLRSVSVSDCFGCQRR